jgi:cell wall-associated NlpC family hydrolase
VAALGKRTLAGISGAAVAGTIMVVAPTAATPANATNRIAVKNEASAKKLRQHIVNIAKRKVGNRYILGSTGPSAFDCSGLVVYSYRKATGKTLPRTSYSQRSAVRYVKPANRKPGDLVFFNGNGHVAIYMGNNKIVHASNPRRGVRIDRLSGWYSSRLGSYGRVVEVR